MAEAAERSTQGVKRERDDGDGSGAQHEAGDETLAGADRSYSPVLPRKRSRDADGSLAPPEFEPHPQGTEGACQGGADSADVDVKPANCAPRGAAQAQGRAADQAAPQQSNTAFNDEPSPASSPRAHPDAPQRSRSCTPAAQHDLMRVTPDALLWTSSIVRQHTSAPPTPEPPGRTFAAQSSGSQSAQHPTHRVKCAQHNAQPPQAAAQPDGSRASPPPAGLCSEPPFRAEHRGTEGVVAGACTSASPGAPPNGAALPQSDGAEQAAQEQHTSVGGNRSRSPPQQQQQQQRVHCASLAQPPAVLACSPAWPEPAAPLQVGHPVRSVQHQASAQGPSDTLAMPPPAAAHTVTTDVQRQGRARAALEQPGSASLPTPVPENSPGGSACAVHFARPMETFVRKMLLANGTKMSGTYASCFLCGVTYDAALLGTPSCPLRPKAELDQAICGSCHYFLVGFGDKAKQSEAEGARLQPWPELLKVRAAILHVAGWVS
jgi:hypothetical protein